MYMQHPINAFFGLRFALCLFLAGRGLPTWQALLKWSETVFLGSTAAGILLSFLR